LKIKPLVYLAGPIANTGADEATLWRSDAYRALYARDIEALSPMRAKETLAQEAIGCDFHAYQDRGVFFTSRGIMTRDFNDVKRCDAALVNLLGARKLSAGTVMELAWLYLLQKPVVVAIEASGNPHDNHPMIHEAIPFRVTTLDEAIDAVAVILGR
jgi:nucleoside 2-deoxyribosyltransferase